MKTAEDNVQQSRPAFVLNSWDTFLSFENERWEQNIIVSPMQKQENNLILSLT